MLNLDASIIMRFPSSFDRCCLQGQKALTLVVSCTLSCTIMEGRLGRKSEPYSWATRLGYHRNQSPGQAPDITHSESSMALTLITLTCSRQAYSMQTSEASNVHRVGKLNSIS